MLCHKRFKEFAAVKVGTIKMYFCCVLLIIANKLKFSIFIYIFMSYFSPYVETHLYCLWRTSLRVNMFLDIFFLTIITTNRCVHKCTYSYVFLYLLLLFSTTFFVVALIAFWHKHENPKISCVLRDVSTVILVFLWWNCV